MHEILLQIAPELVFWEPNFEPGSFQLTAAELTSHAVPAVEFDRAL